MTGPAAPLDARGLLELDTWARRWCALEQMRTQLLAEQAGLLARIRHVLPAGVHRTRSGVHITVAPPRRRSTGDRSGRLRYDVHVDDQTAAAVPAVPAPARRRSVISTGPAPAATFSAPLRVAEEQP